MCVGAIHAVSYPGRYSRHERRIVRSYSERGVPTTGLKYEIRRSSEGAQRRLNPAATEAVLGVKHAGSGIPNDVGATGQSPLQLFKFQRAERRDVIVPEG
jgi:hypothetical protein